MKRACLFTILAFLFISCANISDKSIPGSYSSSGSHILDLGNNGDVYWQRVRKDGTIETREGQWSSSGSSLYLEITKESVMKGQAEMHGSNVSDNYTGEISGKCIKIKSIKYCK